MLSILTSFFNQSLLPNTSVLDQLASGLFPFKSLATELLASCPTIDTV